MRKKITDLNITRYRTSYQKDRYGNRHKIRTPYTAKRPVKVVEGGERFAHFFIDLIMFSLLSIPLEFILAFIDYIPQTIGASIFMSFFPSYLLYALYYFIFESLMQSTPGKILTKSLVINEYGEKPTRKELVVRSLVRLVPFEALSCLSEQGWHDRWSNTWVVKKEELQKIQIALSDEA
jgi:uncharacterized RDD family membrane protein YckC